MTRDNTLFAVQVVKNGSRTEFILRCDNMETIGNTLEEAVESMRMMVNSKFNKLKEALNIVK